VSGTTPGRLLDLLALLQMPRAWRGAELAERLGVTTRTVRNDVERLRQLGYRIDGFRGSAGGYRLAPGTRMPPLLLDDGDVIAITAGLLTTQTGGIAGMDEHAQRALAKLEHVMPPALRRRADALRTAVVQVSADAPPPSIDPDVLAVISAACHDHEILRFDYRTHAGDRAERRVVEPYRLVNWGRRWYLFAYDTARTGWRTYRVDRMAPNPPAGPRFRPRTLPVGDVAAYVSRGVSAASWRYRTTVTVLAPASDFAEMPPAAGIIEAVDEHTCRLTTGADSLTTLAVHLGLLDHEFRVDEPPALVAKVGELADRYARAITHAGEAAPPRPRRRRGGSD
jgi:predicted DNA-binding transcriptional regulator YafY